jgi:hypothetical protein
MQDVADFIPIAGAALAPEEEAVEMTDGSPGDFWLI